MKTLLALSFLNSAIQPCPSYSAPKSAPTIAPLPECEPYKKTIRTLIDTVHAKDEAVTALQAQVSHKEEEKVKLSKLAEPQTDIETVLVVFGLGLMGGVAAGRLVK